MLELGKIVGSPLYNLLITAIRAQPQQAHHYADVIRNFLRQTQTLQNRPAIIDKARKVIEMLESTKPTEEAMTTAPYCLRNYLPTYQQQKNANGYSPQPKETGSYTLSSQSGHSKPVVGG